MLESLKIEVLEPVDLFSEIYPSHLCHSPENSERELLNYMKDISAGTVAVFSNRRSYSSTLNHFPKLSIKVFEKNGELVKAETAANIIIVSEDDPKARYRLLQIAFATQKPIFFETISREIIDTGLVYPVESNINDLKDRSSLEIIHIDENSNIECLRNNILRVA